MKRKWLAVGIILLFVGTCVIPATAQDIENTHPASRGNWLYVGGSGPGNYTKIQNAINAALDGDTVFVYHYLSPYHENIIIKKSINLIGENKNNTMILCDDAAFDVVIDIIADNVTVSGFHIKNPNGLIGIQIVSNFNNINNNIIDVYGDGLFLHLVAEKNIIFENSIVNCLRGIFLNQCSDNKIMRNNFLFNTIDAFFKDSFSNFWFENYWQRPRILPKIIFGCWSQSYPGYEPTYWPIFKLDIRPALLPINITLADIIKSE